MVLQLVPGPARVLSSDGHYEAFPVAGFDGSRLVGLWRRAKPYGHATDPGALVEGATSEAPGDSWGTPFLAYDDGSDLVETSPSGLAWDPTRAVWVSVTHVKVYAALGASDSTFSAGILTSSDGKTWRVARDTMNVGGVSWWYPSDLAIDDAGRWIVAGYGALTGGSTWVPLVTISTDAGATWCPAAAPSGLPALEHFAEPQLVKTKPGEWLMTVRCDDDSRLHMARSLDGVTWTYSGAALTGVSGAPAVACAADGTLVVLLREKPVIDGTHGSWLWATSSDNGHTWTKRTDWPNHQYMMYGSLVALPDGSLACIFSSEDNEQKTWATASILVTRLTMRDVPPSDDSVVSRQVAQPWVRPQWRYLAYRVNGDGTESLLHPEVPFTEPEIEDVLSGISSFKASMPVEQSQFEDAQGASLFVPWSTMIVPERGGVIRGCFLVTEVDAEGPSLSVQAQGFTAYPKDMPFDADVTHTNYDACDALRELWTHIQSQPGANLGLQVDTDVESGVLLGRVPAGQWKEVNEGDKQPLWPVGANFRYTWVKEPAVKASTVKTTKLVNHKRVPTVKSTPAKPATMETDWYGECVRTYPSPVPAGASVILRDRATGVLSRDTNGKGLPRGYDVFGVITKKAPKDDDDGTQLEPYAVNWWTDTDLGSKIDTVCEQGGFDYWEDHRWNADGTIAHHLRLAAPAAGRVRDDLRFVVGENITAAPQLQDLGEYFASEVLVLGAGEGRAMIRGSWKMSPNPRTRRVKVVADKTIRTVAEANQRAAREGRIANGGVNITSVTVLDHPNAPIGSWNLGDTIPVWGSGAGWAATFDLKVRVLSWTEQPETSTATLTVAAAGRASQ